jgi:hypothetical protein
MKSLFRWKTLMQRSVIKVFHPCFIILGICALNACVSHPPATIAKPISCEQHCLNQALICNEICQNSCAICQAKSKERARQDHARYTWVHRAKGQIVARELNSFRDPLACTKVTCDCVADYQTCKQVCRGKISPNLKSTHCIDSEIPCDYWLRDLLAG